MRKLIFFFLLIPVCHLMAQFPNYNMLYGDSFKNGIKSITSYEYKEVGFHLDKCSDSLFLNKGRKSISHYDTDGKKRKIEVLDAKLGGQLEFFYSKEGLLDSIITVDKNGQKKTAMYFERIEPNLLKIRTLNYQKGELSDTRETLNSLTAQGKPLVQIDSVNNQRVEYIYTEDGEIHSSKAFRTDTLEEYIFYEYERGEKVKWTSVTPNHEVKVESLYTKEGDISIQRIVENGRSDYIKKDRTFYDAMGNRIKSCMEENDSGIVVVREYLIEYWEEGN